GGGGVGRGVGGPGRLRDRAVAGHGEDLGVAVSVPAGRDGLGTAADGVPATEAVTGGVGGDWGAFGLLTDGAVEADREDLGLAVDVGDGGDRAGRHHLPAFEVFQPAGPAAAGPARRSAGPCSTERAGSAG